MSDLFDLWNIEYNLWSQTYFSLGAVYMAMVYGHQDILLQKFGI